MSDLDRWWSKIHKTDGCWLWTDKPQRGYGQFFVEGKKQRAHRWGYGQLVGPIPEGLVVRHRCDNTLCCRPDHWLLGTQAENVADMVERARQAREHRFPQCKISSEQVLEIRTSVESNRVLAERYGVTRPTISKIKTGARR